MLQINSNLNIVRGHLIQESDEKQRCDLETVRGLLGKYGWKLERVTGWVHQSSSSADDRCWSSTCERKGIFDGKELVVSHWGIGTGGREKIWRIFTWLSHSCSVKKNRTWSKIQKSEYKFAIGKGPTLRILQQPTSAIKRTRQCNDLSMSWRFQSIPSLEFLVISPANQPHNLTMYSLQNYIKNILMKKMINRSCSMQNGELSSLGTLSPRAPMFDCEDIWARNGCSGSSWAREGSREKIQTQANDRKGGDACHRRQVEDNGSRSVVWVSLVHVRSKEERGTDVSPCHDKLKNP